ncbi:hypothetical protein BKA82DRAFT_10734 [Pisolithus tinctorius]|uniref:Uncharacterized protein n=1 Tax=Pisolithus tinctorius Marx 270 TaxID=870435 RepID=A0A0C3NQH8_PISTI|nr:hypothetical protein BKA82DRAFT_10734 [Pisolithus tinctorius]KIN97563.1 hypothetical protein M404DRAFT_10734 [Pisolithus tinctorius Marx 270]
MQLDVLVANSSFGMGTDDSVVSSWILHGKAGNLQVAVSQPVSLGGSMHTSVSILSWDGSAVSMPVPGLLLQVVPSSGYTHRSLVFLPVPCGDHEDDAPPGIDVAASWHFVIHQQLVGKLLDLVKAILSNEDADAQVEKEKLTAEIRAGKSMIQEHSNFQLLSNQFLCYQAFLQQVLYTYFLGYQDSI